MFCLDWNVVKRAQSRLGLTDTALAEKIGVTRQQIANWRFKKTAPSSSAVLEKICKVLGLKCDDILFEPLAIQEDLFTDILEGMLALTKLEQTILKNEDTIKKVSQKKTCSTLLEDIVNLRQEVSQLYPLLEKEKDRIYAVQFSTSRKEKKNKK